MRHWLIVISLALATTSFAWPWTQKPDTCRHFIQKLRPVGKPRAANNHIEIRRLGFAEISDAIRAPENIVRKNFYPDQVLRKHGVDPNSISLRWRDFAADDEALFSIEVYGGDKYPLSFITVKKSPYPNLKLVHVDSVNIFKESDRGRGLGSLMYLLAAHVSATQFGFSLASTPTIYAPHFAEWLNPGHSDFAEFTWVNFVRNGYAKELRTKTWFSDTNIFYVIDADEWKQTPDNQAIADFYNQHLALNPP